jgi:DNA-binding HxlR family transcriptional regulator
VRTYGQYCPISRGAEIFATRWTPIIVRNLLLGCRSFGELRDGAPGIPRTVLAERLRQLEAHGIVERRENPHGRGGRYFPTQACRDLLPVCDALGVWGATWVELAPHHLDPYVALWSLCRGLSTLALPEERVTVRFELPALSGPQRRFWVLVQAPAPEVCIKPPGFEEDVVVTADPEWLARWVLGQSSLGEGMKARRVSVVGPRELVRTVGAWGEQAAHALRTWDERTFAES